MDIKSFYIFCALSSVSTGQSSGRTVYGKIGEDVYLHLQVSHNRSYNEIKWRRQDKAIAKRTRVYYTSAEIFVNGTLKLNNIGRNHGGIYTATAYNDLGTMELRENSLLVVIDPPVVELVYCAFEFSVLHCIGENGPDAVYEWRVSVQNQGFSKVLSYPGKHVFLNYTVGNISCSLIKGNYSSQSETYFLSCTGLGELPPEIKWYLTLVGIILLVLFCITPCGIAVAVLKCQKLPNSNVKFDEDITSLVVAQDDGNVYTEVRFVTQQK